MVHTLLAAALLASAPDAPAGPEDSFEPRRGERQTFTARYVVEPMAGGKKAQTVVLLREDGEEWIHSYRPVPEEYRFIDRKVVVTGRPYRPSALVASIQATHVQVEEMHLAPGEQPHPEPLDVLPAPPEVATLAALSARSRLWVRAFGRLQPLSKGCAPCTAVLELSDGKRIEVLSLRPSELQRWQGLVGQEVTVLGRVLPPSAEQPERWALGGQLALCPGHAPRCGMDSSGG